MSTPPHETCWTLVQAAALGKRREREELTRRYLPVVRAYMTARWRGTAMRDEIDDGVQEVFVACFREGGALQRVSPEGGAGFRAFLRGVAGNVALHMERTHARRRARLGSAGTGLAGQSAIPIDEPSLSRVYDRAFARSLMREARECLSARARAAGEAAVRRFELLELRFEEGLPIREIARLWGAEPSQLHLEYAKAAREFRAALREVVGLSERCDPDRLDRECDRLLELLE